ncbi:IclR family transcriptional regulator [Cupriavidus sp. 30B13]|uniref:IclR family transcriptional regulator n=1 Tax=Cupriavidus sp. 30B13 TaxID=3384241 RepID=UPI003B8FCF82
MPERRTGTQSIERAVDLLRVIAMGGHSGMRLKEVVAASGLAEATVVRIVQGLVACGMLTRNERSNRLVLGPLVQELGLLTRDEIPADVLACQGLVRELAALTGETIYLNRRNGFDSVCVDVAMGANPVQAHPISVGVRRPLGAGAGGIAMLATLPDREVAACIAHNAPRYGFYGLDAPGVERLVEEAKAKGFALLRGLTIRAVSVVALPIPGPAPQRSVGFSGMTTRLTDAAIAAWVPQVRARIAAAAQRLDEETPQP